MNSKITIAGLACLIVAGCASVSVTKDALTQRTASALGVSASQFTISNRSDSGLRTDYDVQTSAGKRYACYVTGTMSVTGRVVSDAMCSANPTTQSPAEKGAQKPAKCNALLEAAGKCKQPE